MTTLKDWMPVVVACVIPGVGTLYQVGQKDADAKAAQAAIAEMKKQVATTSDVATATSVRVDQLESRARVVDDALRELNRTMQRLDGNLIAVCSATRGAQCVR